MRHAPGGARKLAMQEWQNPGSKAVSGRLRPAVEKSSIFWFVETILAGKEAWPDLRSGPMQRDPSRSLSCLTDGRAH
jgi:hypothetical protein